MTDYARPSQDDGWDMSARRERAVMFEHPGAEADEPETPQMRDGSNVRLPTGRNVLSQAELDALLRPNLDDMPDEEDEPGEVSPKPIDDFTEPSNPADEPFVPDAQAMHEARRLAARLSLSLRQDCGLKSAATVSKVRQEEFALALEGAGRGVAVACFAAPNGEIACMLMLSAPLTSALIETACGGAPSSSSSANRALTPLDAALLEGLVRPLGAAVAGHLSFARVETDAAFAAALASPGKARIIDLDFRVEHMRLPATLIMAQDDLFEEEGAPESRQRHAEIGAPAPADPTISSTPSANALTAVLTARIASITAPLSRLSNLKPGSTLLLGVPADQPISLLSGGRDGTLAAEGEIGRKGANIAVRVTKKGPALR